VITADDINNAEPGTVLAEVKAVHNGRIVKAVAVRGGIADWAVYVGDVDDTTDHIARQGQKVFPELRDFPVAATKDAIKLYRY